MNSAHFIDCPSSKSYIKFCMSSLAQITQFQTQHLILLVGENPLPNYVAASLLLKDGGCVHLLYSTRTDNIALCLGQLLQDQGFEFQRISIGDKESNSAEIARRVSDHIDLLPPEKTLGLHYTGGTKVMATHAYRTVFEKRPNSIFSYLNPRNLTLCIEDHHNQRTIPIPVGTMVEPTLEQILKLQNLKILSYDEHPQLADKAAVIAQLYTDPELIKQWRNFCDSAFRNDKGEFKRENELKTLGSLSTSALDSRIQRVLTEHFDAISDQLNLEQAKQRSGFTTQKSFFKWLDGLWLENYVQQQIQNLPAHYNLREIVRSLKPQDPAKHSRKPKEERFEFDISFLRGYQLFGISCTTDQSRPLCKSKLIETCLRVKQLGGDEARIALVCAYSDANDLREEVSLMGDDLKIEIFCYQDLEIEAFSNKLKNWIERNIEEQSIED
jgi:hypothetical protein